MTGDTGMRATVTLEQRVADLANLIGRLAFLLQNEIGDNRSRRISNEADAIREALRCEKT